MGAPPPGLPPQAISSYMAAAMATGFPPNVEAWAPGFQSIKSARATHKPSGKPEAIPLAMQTMSAFTP